MKAITEIINDEKRELAYSIIDNNIRILEDGSKVIKDLAPFKVNYDSDLDLKTQIIEDAKSKIGYTKKVLKIFKNLRPTDYCIINQLKGRIDYYKAQIHNTKELDKAV